MIDPVRAKALQGVISFGRQGLADQMRKMIQPPAPVQEQALDPESVESMPPPGEHTRAIDPESLAAEDLESLLDQ